MADLITEPDPDHTGSAATRNRALERVQTEWLLPLDSDDVLMPNATQLLCEAQERSGGDVISGSAWIPQVAGHGEVIGPEEGVVPTDQVKARSWLNCSALMRTEDVRAVGGWEFRWDAHAGLMLDDYGLFYKLASLGKTFIRIPETVIIWNVNGNNTSGQPW